MSGLKPDTPKILECPKFSASGKLRLKIEFEKDFDT